MNATLVKTLATTKLKVAKHSPMICMVTGIGLIGASMVLIGTTTLKVDDIRQEHQDDLARIKAGREEYTLEEYSERDYNHDITKAYCKMAVRMAKRYVVPVAIGAAGIGLVIWSNHILQARNTALMAAYTVINDRFQRYRDRIRDDYGEEYESQVYHNQRKIQEKVKVTDEDGKTHSERVDKVIYDGYLSKYGVVFDQTTSRQYKTNYEGGNKFFFECVNNSVNNLFHARGHLFLNDVLRQLGMDDTPEGAVVGWIDDGDGVKTIEFGIPHNGVIEPLEIEGLDGQPAYLLDFNVDGIIYDLI